VTSPKTLPPAGPRNEEKGSSRGSNKKQNDDKVIARPSNDMFYKKASDQHVTKVEDEMEVIDVDDEDTVQEV
jgi:hypothetical protein